MNLPIPDPLAQARQARPVSFLQDGRALAGWYHPPAAVDGRTRDCLVLLCNPLGYEAICTHRHYRVLAQQLAREGFAVLRYDHHGTGDSDGGDEDPTRVATWVAGVGCALAFGRQCSGATRVSLFGVRMGATLALAAAAGVGADSLIAWAPFASGRAYLRETRALRLAGAGAGPAQDVGADPGEEAAGYLLSAATVAELEQLDPIGAQAPAPAVLLLGRDDLLGGERLTQPLQQRGCQLDQRSVPGYAAMMRDTFDAEVPLAAFAEVSAWLQARYPRLPPAGLVLDPVPMDAGEIELHGGVCERALQFGPGGRLFGVLCRPRQAGARARTGVVFVSVGSNHHVGPNRMYVTQARQLAALGFLSLRIDIGGVGESPPQPGQRDNQLYAEHSIAEVRAALRCLLQQRQVERVVLVGLCSGAYLSFHAALADPGVAGIVLINPQTFTWREGDSLQLRSRRSIQALGFYRSRLLEAATWQRLLQGRISAGLIISGVAATLRQRAVLRLRQALRPRGGAGGPRLDVRKAFRSLLQRRVNTLLIYSGDDGGLNEMETHLGKNARTLRRQAGFELRIVPGADHTFTPRWAQQRLLQLITRHLLRLYG